MRPKFPNKKSRKINFWPCWSTLSTMLNDLTVALLYEDACLRLQSSKATVVVCNFFYYSPSRRLHHTKDYNGLSKLRLLVVMAWWGVNCYGVMHAYLQHAITLNIFQKKLTSIAGINSSTLTTTTTKALIMFVWETNTFSYHSLTITIYNYNCSIWNKKICPNIWIYIYEWILFSYHCWLSVTVGLSK